MVVEQFLSGFHYGDAVGNSVMRFHRFLLKKGIESRIVSITTDEKLEADSINFSEYREIKDSVKIYHFAISSPLTDFFLRASGKKIIVYHNITPSHFFLDYSPSFVRSTSNGRKELKKLSGVFDISVADSEYNAKELKELGFKNVKVFPIMVDIDEYRDNFNRGLEEYFNSDKKNIVFVGRVSPNKKIEDILKFFSLYRELTTTPAKLIIAGYINGVPLYYHSIRDYADSLQLKKNELYFTGHIPFAELISIYRTADLFLSMSEHEGFCLPLIESMIFNIPVVAFSAGAVEETLKSGGIVFKKKEFEKLAFLVEKVFNDKELNLKLKKLSQERIDEYRSESDPEKLFSIISEE